MIKKSLNGNQLSVVFGVTPITGFAKDTSLAIETRDGLYNYNTDLYGNVTRRRINDNSAKITLTLTQSSSSNELMKHYIELDHQSDSGIFPIVIKDANKTIFTSANASVVLSDEHWEDKHKEWVIMATDNNHYIGS